MPTNITEVSTFTATVPVPNDGEGATAASLLQTAQPLANRTKKLKSILDAGVTKVRIVADITALKALTGMATDDCALVFGVGLYSFDGTTTPGSDTSPWIIKPGAGAGRWVHELNLTRAGLMPAGTSVFNMSQSAISTGTSSSAATSLTDVAGWNYDLTSLDVSDRIYIDVHFGAYSSSGAATTTIHPVVVDDFGGVAIAVDHAEADATTTATATVPFHRSFIHTVTAAGTSRIKLQMKSNSGTASLVGDGLFRVLVLRP